MNNELTIKFKKLSEKAIEPTYSKYGDCACDLHSIEHAVIDSMERRLIDTGIAIELPENYEAQIRPRSGNAWKKGLTVLNTPGTIDYGYRNSLKVILINLSNEPVTINMGDRIAQMKFSPVYKGNFIEVSELSNTERGIKGIGSTGN